MFNDSTTFKVASGSIFRDAFDAVVLDAQRSERWTTVERTADFERANMTDREGNRFTVIYTFSTDEYDVTRH